MTVDLMYGDGIAGRTYYLVLDGQGFPLNEHATLGTPDDARAARDKAQEVLKEQVKDLPTLIRLQQLLLILKFKWNGCM